MVKKKMKKKKINILIIIITFLALLTTLYKPVGVNADSGFDTSYGGGYSSSDWGGSSSSWGGSSSNWSSRSSDYGSYHSRSYGSYGSSSYNSSNSFGMIITITTISSIILFFIIFAIISSLSSKKESKKDSLPLPTPVNDDLLKKYIEDYDKTKFLEDRYNDFLKIQEDWMNFNYEGLKENLTDELYNEYEMQLETLKVNDEKNIMKNFEFGSIHLSEVKEENEMLTVVITLNVSFIDYIEKDKNVVRGNKIKKVHHTYSLTFIMKPQSIDKCPNCGAKLNDKSNQVCPYCRSKITRVGTKWVMSKKISKRQY